MLLPDEPGDKPSAGRAAEALKPLRGGFDRLAGNSLARDLLAGHVQQAGLDLVGHGRGHGNHHHLHSPPPPKPDVAKLDRQPVAHCASRCRK